MSSLLSRNFNRSIANIMYIFTIMPACYAIFSRSSYALGWDDADYLRMSICLPVNLANLDFTNFLICQQDLYKSPLLMNLGLVLTPYFMVYEVLDVLITIKIFVFMLSLITFYLYFNLQSYFNSSVTKLGLSLGFLLIFYNFRSLYMTDMINALVIVIITFKFFEVLNSYDKRQVKRLAIQLGILSACALGIRTTSAPIYMLIIYSTYIIYVRFKSRSIFLYLWAPTVVLSIFLITVWKSVIVSALSMFSGDISQYTGKWINFQNIDSYRYTLQILGLGFIFTICVYLSRFVQKKSKGLSKIYLIAMMPALSVFILYAFSQSKDPRFLLWPLFQILCIEIYARTHQRNSDYGYPLLKKLGSKLIWIRMLRTLVVGITLSGLFTFNSIPKNSDFNLTTTLQVYELIPSHTGFVCPLTDSSNLNISKILLIDQMHQGKKNLRNRLINIPDSIMNGKSLEEIKLLIKSCTISFNELAVDSKSMKNEFLSEKLSAAISFRTIITHNQKVSVSFNDVIN
jgi:hypothetical protein